MKRSQNWATFQDDHGLEGLQVQINSVIAIDEENQMNYIIIMFHFILNIFKSYNFT